MHEVQLAYLGSPKMNTYMLCFLLGGVVIVVEVIRGLARAALLSGRSSIDVDVNH